MTLTQRIDALVQLGAHLLAGDEFLEALMQRTAHHNPWFTVENQRRAVEAIAREYLQREALEGWLAPYGLPEENTPRTVGLVLAGNIPLVGFHDVLCVFVAGHRAKIKLSEKDPYLLPHLLGLLERFQPGAKDCFEVVEQLKGFDAVIATGSNNSARYFEAYFGRYPHIIRRNRNAVAVLRGDETDAELLALGNDVFQYFGLGCRNVSKVFVPQDYDLDRLLEAFEAYREVILHEKYKNNFDYNLATAILNREEHRHNGCLILKPAPALPSRIATLHYEPYESVEHLVPVLQSLQDQIQCIVARDGTLPLPTVPFGRAQQPRLQDYADGVDTLAFLLGLNSPSTVQSA